MEVVYHPRVRDDVREIVSYYDEQAGATGDRFLQELRDFIETVRQNPTRFHPVDRRRRRCNLKRFPYHFIFELTSSRQIRILVVRHHKRHPGFGLGRR